MGPKPTVERDRDGQPLVRTLPRRPPGHPLYEAAQRQAREQEERIRAARERVPTPTPSPTPPPSDPDTDLDKEEPYQLLLDAARNKKVDALTALLKRADVKKSLASKRNHRKTIPLLEAAIPHRELETLKLLLGLSKNPGSTSAPAKTSASSSSSSSSTPGPATATTKNMNAWPWVFRAALLSEEGGQVIFAAFTNHRVHDRNLVRVLTILKNAVNLLSPADGAKTLVNQTIHIKDRVTEGILEKYPLDLTLATKPILSLSTAFLIRNGADTTKKAHIPGPAYTFHALLFAPSIEIADTFWPKESTTDGEQRYEEFISTIWEADWARCVETNTLNTIFPRWCKELDKQVSEHVDKITAPVRTIRFEYKALEKRWIVTARFLYAKYKEMERLGPEKRPAGYVGHRVHPDTIRDINKAGLLCYFQNWRPIKFFSQ